jgi:ribokinase
VVVWPDGDETVPRLAGPAADPTGCGDAMVASLAVSLLRGTAPAEAAWQAGPRPR